MSYATLSLIFDADAVSHGNEALAFEEALRRRCGRSSLRAEVAAIEAWYGPNAYSEFLLKHGRRPDREQASTIGRLIGARVKAADGRMYPVRNLAERKALRADRQRAKEEDRSAVEIHRLRKAIVELAANTSDPGELISYLCPDVDEPEIRSQLQDAVEWFTRFAEEWHRREKGRADRNPRLT